MTDWNASQWHRGGKRAIPEAAALSQNGYGEGEDEVEEEEEEEEEEGTRSSERKLSSETGSTGLRDLDRVRRTARLS